MQDQNQQESSKAILIPTLKTQNIAESQKRTLGCVLRKYEDICLKSQTDIGWNSAEQIGSHLPILFQSIQHNTDVRKQAKQKSANKVS